MALLPARSGVAEIPARCDPRDPRPVGSVAARWAWGRSTGAIAGRGGEIHTWPAGRGGGARVANAGGHAGHGGKARVADAGGWGRHQRPRWCSAGVPA
jgi:hypothetical protein